MQRVLATIYLLMVLSGAQASAGGFPESGAGSQLRSQDKPSAFWVPSFLSVENERAFRQWVILIAKDQIQRGANPRWNHRDCAGLVRFAVLEAFKSHDEKWRKANGFLDRALPPEIEMEPAQKQVLTQWKTLDGKKSAYVRAMTLIQQNSYFIGKSSEHLEPGDLAFFDQEDDQHLMIWTGQNFIYHNGAEKPVKGDNGLRTASFRDLLQWKDARWRMTASNSNFIGFFRFHFLRNNNLGIASDENILFK